MRQKTIYIDPLDLTSFTTDYITNRAKPGDEVILIEYHVIGTDHDYYDIVEHKGEGIPGNSNPSIKCYHGWRGSSSTLETNACGVRRILSITLADWQQASDRLMAGKPLRRCDMHKVVVGPDIHPDWD